jgi:hypothetical protein
MVVGNFALEQQRPLRSAVKNWREDVRRGCAISMIEAVRDPPPCGVVSQEIPELLFLRTARFAVDVAPHGRRNNHVLKMVPTDILERTPISHRRPFQFRVCDAVKENHSTDMNAFLVPNQV